MPVKSAFSETTTRNGIIEYNVVGITREVTLIFARDETPVDLGEIDLKFNSQVEDMQLEDEVLAMAQRGEGVGTIISEDDDDIRILDSLPGQTMAKKKQSYP